MTKPTGKRRGRPPKPKPEIKAQAPATPPQDGDEVTILPASRFLKKMRFKTPGDFEAAIYEYFLSCEQQKEAPTMCGIAVALGIHKQTMYEYGRRPGYTEIFSRAQTFVEAYWEARLAKGSPVGAIFWLKNKANSQRNAAFWKDTVEVNNNHTYGEKTEEELQALLEERLNTLGIPLEQLVAKPNIAPSTPTEH